MEIIDDVIVLSDEATEVFGDIVEYAYIKMPSWSDKEKFKGQVFDSMIEVKNGIEPEDSYPVFIKFKNGKEFLLWSSEWGGVRSKSEKQYLEDL